MRKSITIPQPPELKVSGGIRTLNTFDILEDEIALSNYLEVLEYSLAEAEVEIVSLYHTVKQEEHRVRDAIYEGLNKSAMKTNESQRETIVFTALNNDRAFQIAKEEHHQCESEIIKLKALIRSQSRWLGVLKDIVSGTSMLHVKKAA